MFENKGFFENMSAKQGLVMGISWGIAAASLIGLLVMAGVQANTSGIGVNTGDGGTVLGANVNTGDQPTPQQPTEPTGDVTKISPVSNQDYVRGDKNAKITLIEYSDFQCPFCQRHVATIDKVLQDYKGKVRLVFRNFPLVSIHPYAQKAAEAAECAGEQGKFWEMHDKLFQNQSALDTTNLKKYAGELGLKQSQFDQCLDSGKYADKISKQSAEAQAAGVTGTPGTFVGTELVKGAYPYDYFKQILDEQLK